MGESRRLRFSLATLLLVTTIAAMGITITLLMREIGPLRAEVKKLREETGKLWIEDETKIHAIRVESNEDLTWKWRVWLPKGQQYTGHYLFVNVPANGFPKDVGMISSLEPGEHVVTFRYRRAEINGDWTFRLEWDPGDLLSGSLPIRWLDNRTGARSDGVERKNQVFAWNQPVELIRYRTLGTNSVSNLVDSSQPRDGFMLWIEPVK